MYYNLNMLIKDTKTHQLSGHSIFERQKKMYTV